MSDLAAALLSADLGIQTAADAADARGWLNTGNYALNWAISGRFSRGWPLGHAVEVFGDPSSGKSFLLNRAIAMAQLYGGTALLDDTEGAFNTDLAHMVGIDLTRLFITHSETVDEHYHVAKHFFSTLSANPDVAAVPNVLLLDALGTLTTEHEKTVELDKPSMTRAKEIRAMYRLLSGPLVRAPAVYISANHTIATFDPFSPPQSPGGGGLKFQASVRLYLMTPRKLKKADGGEFTGVMIQARVEKSRFTPPWKKVALAIPFDQPISPFSGLLPVLLELEVVTASKGHTVVFQEKDTKVKVQKSDFLKQDHSALDLVMAHPEILKVADAVMEERIKLTPMPPDVSAPEPPPPDTDIALGKGKKK